jgi:mono/diheme cytochrome c family protein
LRRGFKGFIAAAVLLGLGGIAFILLTKPEPLTAAQLPQHAPDIERGKILYIIGGCISCHKPADKAGRDMTLPSGGRPLKTPIGTVYPPNITPDKATGIGNWSTLDFVNAVHGGISPTGSHYIPAFPYPSFHRMPLSDVIDLQAYAFSLPGVNAANRPAANVPLPWLLRRGVGLWKRLALGAQPFAPDPSKSAQWNRGAYLVNAPGHCGECHTSRNIFRVPDERRHMAGGPHPEGKDRVPSLRNLIGRKRYADAEELTSAMRFGETMGFDRLSSGGMGDVQANLAMLPEEDVRAIAEYLITLK